MSGWSLWNNKYMKFLILVLLVAIVLFSPLLIAWFIDLKIFRFARGSVESWIGFWGGYLGGVIGMLAVISTTFYMVNKQTKENNIKIKLQQTQFEKQLQLQRDHFEIQLEKQAESLKITDENERNRIYLEIMINETNQILSLLNRISLQTNDFFIMLKDLYLGLYKAETDEYIGMQLPQAMQREYELYLNLNELLSLFFSKVNFLEDVSDLEGIDSMYKESKDVKNKINDIIINSHHELKEYDGQKNKSQDMATKKMHESDERAKQIIAELNQESVNYKDYLVELIIKLKD